MIIARPRMFLTHRWDTTRTLGIDQAGYTDTFLTADGSISSPITMFKRHIRITTKYSIACPSSIITHHPVGLVPPAHPIPQPFRSP